MDPLDLQRTYLDLTTPHVADAVMRLGIPVRQAPASVRPVWPGVHVVGRARPTRHTGSVDVFLEALEHARPGDVLVVDNDGRDDEACVGDLVTLEVAQAGLAGIIIWGLHRDTRELHTIGLPVFSQGTLPAGPQRLDPQSADALTTAQVGGHTVTEGDFVLADDDGVLFLPLDRAADIAEAATGIRDTERRQAARMRLGTSIRTQASFTDYLTARDRDGVTFRQHLRAIGGEIEE
ncbi:MAG: RraA family protein [Actinomyces sp.]|jgi:regulator of RNase E activity RraA|nr:RraA family protein [Actinomyces sp.]MCI1641898.1 RraA family protein [Actinomyces sp.]MCI1661911.1 RraA family protein [Actinomyces sp.]MCI1691257.1 RraA family protein [Actinomyces sp.]MCI1787714.1 RraA family protein [Actinomyces sp.]MCI1830379.1 RraA family protein [Actinomyces sp.]